MERILWFTIYGFVIICGIAGECIWEREDDKNVVGQYIEEFHGTLEECQDRCEQNYDCKSIDFRIEDGEETCHLNKVTKDEANSYVDLPGVTHYTCNFNGTRVAPQEEEDSDDSDEGVSVEEFWDWLRDEPVYFALIGLGLTILLLVIVIVALICCYVGKEPKYEATPDHVATGLAPIYEEAEPEDYKPEAEDKPEVADDKPTAVIVTNHVFDNPGYVGSQPELEQNHVQQNPIFDEVDANSNLIHDHNRHSAAEPEIVSEPESQPEVTSIPIEPVLAEPDRPDSLTIEAPPSELSNAYEEPIPSPPPPPPVPTKNWNSSTEEVE